MAQVIFSNKGNASLKQSMTEYQEGNIICLWTGTFVSLIKKRQGIEEFSTGKLCSEYLYNKNPQELVGVCNSQSCLM